MWAGRASQKDKTEMDIVQGGFGFLTDFILQLGGWLARQARKANKMDYDAAGMWESRGQADQHTLHTQHSLCLQILLYNP